MYYEVNYLLCRYFIWLYDELLQLEFSDLFLMDIRYPHRQTHTQNKAINY